MYGAAHIISKESISRLSSNKSELKIEVTLAKKVITVFNAAFMKDVLSRGLCIINDAKIAAVLDCEEKQNPTSDEEEPKPRLRV